MIFNFTNEVLHGQTFFITKTAILHIQSPIMAMDIDSGKLHIISDWFNGEDDD